MGATAADLAGWLEVLSCPSPATDDAARIDRIRRLEQLKGAVAAAQAREAVAFKASQLTEQRAAGVSARDLGKGISAQVALARRESPHKGGQLMGLAEALVKEMPYTMAALSAGEVSEWRATIVAQETACLSADDRSAVDALLAPRLASLSDKQVHAEAKRHAYALDPHAIVNRASKAAADRRVTIRPAPDTMSLVNALLPCAQGVAVYAALRADADRQRAAGDPRSRSQIMADTLVERVTGLAKADQAPVEVQLVMTDRALLADDSTEARLPGYGPLPAPVARGLLRSLDGDTMAWIRRLYLDPETGQLVAMESNRRTFDGNRRKMLEIRDDVCRTPWCGAPIRHADHVVPAEDGGSTSEANGQGLCEACNHAKQAHGWTSRPDPRRGAGRRVQITTPTGHTYTSRPPPLPGAVPVPAAELQPAHEAAERQRPLRVDVFYQPEAA